MNPINIGYGTVIPTDRIIAITNPDSAPIKRRIDHALENFRCLDVTFGRRLRSVILMDNGEMIMSAVNADTLQAKWQTLKEKSEDAN